MPKQPELKILWVKVGGLWPITSGGRLRSFHLVRALSHSHRVTVLTTHDSTEQCIEEREQLASCERVTSFFHSPPKWNTARFAMCLLRSFFSTLPVDLFKNRVPALRDEVARSLREEHFDLVVADFMFARPGIRFDTGVPVVFFAHNVEHLIWKRLARRARNPLVRLLLEQEWRKFRRQERITCERAALTIAVSREDVDMFRALAPGRPMRCIGTGVDVEYFRPAAPCLEADVPRLVFTGSMDWHPNEDAMLFFLESILPVVRRHVPDVVMSIVGRNPSARLIQRARQAQVTVTGTVDDVRPFIEEATVYVVPIRVGGGTRLKIFEAMAMAKAVVSTTIGAEGLPLVDGEQVVLADAPEEFARQVVRLLLDRNERVRLGRNARCLVQGDFAWERIASQFDEHCTTALEAA